MYVSLCVLVRVLGGVYLCLCVCVCVLVCLTGVGVWVFKTLAFYGCIDCLTSDTGVAASCLCFMVDVLRHGRRFLMLTEYNILLTVII